MATRDQSQSSDRGRAASGAAPSAAAAGDAETQPDEFPVDFDEWAGGLAPVWRTAIAGFRHTVRAADQLRALRARTAWQADFDTFLGAEPK